MKKENGCPENVIYIGLRYHKFYVYLMKKILKNSDFDFVELIGIGAEKMKTLAQAVELITHLGYAEIFKIKTAQTSYSGRRVLSLRVNLRKTPEFD